MVPSRKLQPKSSRVLIPQNPYRGEVLIHHWFDERRNAEAAIPPLRNTYLTTNLEELGPKPSSRVDPAIPWDQKLASESSNFVPPRRSEKQPHYYKNFTSTYDLAFNHFPSCCKYDRPKRGFDYILSYGNLTRYGLTETKKEEWACGVQDPRRNLSTHYRDTFEPPEKGDYNFKRFGIPCANSSKLPGPNMLNSVVKWRNLPVCMVPEIGLVTPPRGEYRGPFNFNE